MVPIEQLKCFKIFREAPAALLDKISRDMTQKKFRVGDVICKEDAAGSGLYLIASGSVAVEKKAFQAETQSKVVARLEPGEFFGEMAFLQGLPHSATVSAIEETTLFVLERSKLDELIRKDPAAAIDQVMMVSMGLSNRLRSTTRELVTVFETARAVGSAPDMKELIRQVIGQLKLDLGEDTTVAFYRWNMFNDEYAALVSDGPSVNLMPPTIEAQSDLLKNQPVFLESIPDFSKKGRSLVPLTFSKGHVVISRIDMLKERQGLFIFYSGNPISFDKGEIQMMETISAVLAPALSSSQHREEEASRRRLESSKQMGYGT